MREFLRKISHSYFFPAIMLSILFGLLPLFIMPWECSLQIRAANTGAFLNIGKWAILYGFIGWQFLVAYRVMVLPLIMLFPRKQLSSVGVRSLLWRDLIYNYLPMLAVFVINTSLMYFVLFRSTVLDLDIYFKTCFVTTISLVSVIIYVAVYGLLRTMLIGSRLETILLGLSISIPASLLTLVIMLILSPFGDIYLYKCNLPPGYKPINPNTPKILSSLSVGIFGIIINILWYILYATFFLRQIKKHVSSNQ